jgi:hypothetical protein
MKTETETKKKPTKWFGIRKTGFFTVFMLVFVSINEFVFGTAMAGVGFFLSALWALLYNLLNEDCDMLNETNASLYKALVNLREAVEKLSGHDQELIEKTLNNKTDDGINEVNEKD